MIIDLLIEKLSIYSPIIPIDKSCMPPKNVIITIVDDQPGTSIPKKIAFTRTKEPNAKLINEINKPIHVQILSGIDEKENKASMVILINFL